MTNARPADYLLSLVRELCALPRETEWVEFKLNEAEPKEVGEDISALSNAAALMGKAFAYVVWGVRDEDHEVLGTRFDPHETRVGNEELESWLLRLLEPKIDFRFFRSVVDMRQVVILEIARTAVQPVFFSGQAFIRAGNYKKKLGDFPERERALWRILDRAPFEDGVAAERASDDDVLRLLDYPAYFDLLDLPLPGNRVGILEALADDRLIRSSAAGGWDITNLGGVLFAKRLRDFYVLRRKAVRVVQYRGDGRTDALREKESKNGYACGFESLISYIDGLLPANEVVDQGLRRNVRMFPEPAIRELAANALIHQDFSVGGAGPMVEIFDNRIEITNPGEPRVDTRRFVDKPPRSRNDALASLMRRFRICEERGSGIDKVLAQVELHQLPAPLFESPGEFTRVVLFAYKHVSEMCKEDRIRACYLHACLRYVTREEATNSSLRARFGVEEHDRAKVSGFIREAVDAGVIVPADPNAAPKLMTYLPFWAAEGSGEVR